VDPIRIMGARFLISSEIRQHPRIPRQTQSSRARTNGKMGSRYLAEKQRRTKRSQFIVKLDSIAVAIVVGIVSEIAPQTSATGNVISWNLGPLGIHAAQPYIAQAMRKKTAIVMLQEIRIPRGFSSTEDSHQASLEFSEISGGGIQSTNFTLLQAAILT